MIITEKVDTSGFKVQVKKTSIRQIYTFLGFVKMMEENMKKISPEYLPFDAGDYEQLKEDYAKYREQEINKLYA